MKNASAEHTVTICLKKCVWKGFSMRFISAWLISVSLLAVIGVPGAHAFTQVIISTEAPAGIELQFLQATTNQFIADYFKNPLASNTYALKIRGFNPAYNAPPAPPTTLEQALSLGATVYVYGFAAGMGYQQHVATNLVESFEVNCSTPIGLSTSTWDSNTCLTIAGAIDSALFQLSLSTPIVIPPPPIGGF